MRIRPRIPLWLWAVGLSCAAAAAGVGLFHWRGLDPLRRPWLDGLYAARQRLGCAPRPNDAVVLVGVDEASLARARARLPAGASDRRVLRSLLAEVLQRLRQGGVKAVAVDYVLSVELGEAVDGPLLDVLAGTNEHPPLDAVLGSFLVGLAESSRPAAVFRDYAVEGNIFLTADEDGTFRRALPGAVFRLADADVPLWSFQAARLYVGETDNALATPWRWHNGPGEDGSLEVPGKLRVPAEVLIDFCGPPGAFLRLGRQFSAGRLLDGEVPAGALAGRLALVGPMMSMQDRFAVPLARPQDPHALRESLRRQRGIEIDESVEVDIRRLETMSGLEVHANLVAQFLDRRYLRELRAEKPLLAQAAIPAVLLPLGWLTFLPGRPGARRRRLWGLAAAGLLALAVPAAIWGVSLLAFARAGWVWTPVALVAAWGALAATGLLSSARRLRIQNGRIERMFGTAVGRELLEHIHANPQILSRCRRCEATVLFADIRGFTTLSERTDPEGVVEILREHFQGLFPALAEQGAWVDKYAGDLVMAAWGVLDGEEDHALRAVRAAVKMQRARARMNEQRLRRGEDPIEIGIGIHSGPLVAGNVGSEQRSNFTVIGDGVNLASRIEHHAGPGEILISEATWRQVSGDVDAERREGVKIRGKRGEYVLYAVRGLRGADEG